VSNRELNEKLLLQALRQSTEQLPGRISIMEEKGVGGAPSIAAIRSRSRGRVDPLRASYSGRTADVTVSLPRRLQNDLLKGLSQWDGRKYTRVSRHQRCFSVFRTS
jgi:hypothetical protein